MSSKDSLSLTLSLVSYSSTSSWALPASSIIQGQYQGHPTDYVSHEGPCLTLGPSLGHLDHLSYFHFYCQCHHLKRKKFIPIQSEDIISLQKKKDISSLLVLSSNTAIKCSYLQALALALPYSQGPGCL